MRDGRYGLMGPAILITIGAIFLFHELLPEYRSVRLWPVILIVIGVIRILECGGSSGPSGSPGGAPPAGGPASGNPA